MKKFFSGLRSRFKRGILLCLILMGMGALGNANAQHGIFDIPLPKVTGDFVTAQEFRSILNAIQSLFQASRQDCPPGQVAQGFDSNLNIICVNALSYNCTGGIPANSTLCTGDDQNLGSDTPITLVSSCGAPKCEYACTNPYIKYGSNCCLPDCSGKTCGDDGCGGSCGSCGATQSCSGGVCVDNCTPDCSGKTCGDDGCGGSCGSCGVQDCDTLDTDCRDYHDTVQTCSSGTCEATCTNFTNEASGTICGTNGTCDGNGSCSECVADNSCAANTCAGDTCADTCGNIYNGTKSADSSCAADTCTGDTCTDTCGNTFNGTKTDGICDPCSGVTCADSCTGSTRKYNGTCSNGSCSYSTETCAFGCSGDYCAGDPCAGVTCPDDGNPCTGTGTCVDGTCEYPPLSDGSPCGTKDCDYLDDYYISPSNSVLGTSYCKLDNYSDKQRTCQGGSCSNPSCGSPSTSNLTSAGTCLYVKDCSASKVSVDAANYDGADCGDYSCGTDKYQIDGTQAADSTSYCRFYDYTTVNKTCNDGYCGSEICPSPTVSTKITAGLCKKIGACNASYYYTTDYADGTSCGTGKVCQNGSCVIPPKTCGGYLPSSCSPRDSSTYTSTSTYSWVYSTSSTSRPCEYGLPASSTRTANCPSLTTGQVRSGPDTYTQTSTWSFYGYGCSAVWSPTKTNTYGAGSACNFMCASGYSYDSLSKACIENVPQPTCGDGVVNQASEECDDGNSNTGDGCYQCKSYHWGRAPSCLPQVSEPSLVAWEGNAWNMELDDLVGAANCGGATYYADCLDSSNRVANEAYCDASATRPSTYCATACPECIGTIPANSTLCAGDSSNLTSDTTRTLVNTCTSSRKCEYYCGSGTHRSGGECVLDAYCIGDAPSGASLCKSPTGARYTSFDTVNHYCLSPLPDSPSTWNECVYYCRTGYKVCGYGCIPEAQSCGCPSGTKLCNGSCIPISSYCAPDTGGGGDTCFVEHTQISLIDGTTRNIEELKVGDQILGYEDGKVVPAVVEHTFVHEGSFAILHMDFDAGGSFELTSNHPVYVIDKGWVEAGDIRVGDKLLTVDQKIDEVVNITTSGSVDTVYNVQTSTRNYFAEGRLVHNKVAQ